jgi:hypothetical protein
MSEQPQDTAGMAAKVQIGFTLTVHLDDGTTKDIPCVGHISSVTKEQDHDDLRS